MATVLRTARLQLVPMTASIVEAVLLGHRDTAERLANARMPDRWPNRELIERAFAVSIEAVRTDAARLWGARVMIAEDAGERRVVGSIVFRGPPNDGRVAEIAYGVEEKSQRRGFATEGVAACVVWALAQPRVDVVQAATFGWHRASIRVLEKVGMQPAGIREHDVLGEMVVFERRRT